MSRPPAFVVLGQGKSGTSLIYRVLERNPAIALSEPKELHYFSAHYDRGLAWYLSHFAHAEPGQMVGEVSPSYLTPEALPRLLETLGPDTKLIFVLRRPIERAYARYLQDICATQKPGGFHVIARALPGWLDLQHAAIRLCYSLFRPENILPLFFETDIACADPCYERKILAHIGLPPADHAATLDRVNPSVMPHYIVTDERPLITFLRGKRYVIPKHRLIFCAQQRNSEEIRNPDPQQVRDAVWKMSGWSRLIAPEEYAELQASAVLPAADRLERDFGFDLSHWRCPPRRIMYDPALPFPRFQKDAPPDA